MKVIHEGKIVLLTSNVNVKCSVCWQLHLQSKMGILRKLIQIYCWNTNKPGQSYTKACIRKVHIFRYSDSLYSFQMFHTGTCIKINHSIAGRYFHKTCRRLLIFALHNFKTSNDMIVIISSFISINQ